MPTLKERIREDLKSAMKSGETEKRDVIRMIDSMIKNSEIEKGKKEEGLDDKEVIEVLSRAVKQRKDSANQYLEGGRPELADKEKGEIEIISIYLPEQLSEEDLKKIINKVIEDGAEMEMGKLMGKVMAEVKGQADGNLVKQLVQKAIQASK
ncbi:MAG: GatB/YqeY domain-containing protein [Candidatus Moraniibacteriota bacterium]